MELAEFAWKFHNIVAVHVQFWNCILLFQTIKIFIPDTWYGALCDIS